MLCVFSTNHPRL